MSILGSDMKPLQEFLLYYILFSFKKYLLIVFVSLRQCLQPTYVHKGLWSCQGNDLHE